MSEQISNSHSGRGENPAGKGFRVFVAMLLSVCLSACVPSGEQDINTELFKDKEEMKTRCADLRPGIGKKTVFEKLAISPEKFQRMSVQEVQMSIYGNSMVQGTPAELESFRQKLMSYEGYALPYREIKSSSSLGFGKMEVKKTGHDLKLILIFDHGRLMRASVEGTQEVNEKNDQYMWDVLLRRGMSAAF